MVVVYKYKNLLSTNKFAMDNIDNFETNSIIQAETQSEGHGRFSRKWISDKENNCYISFVLKPDLQYRKNFPNLTQYLSVILCEELKTYNVTPSIKWPNDVQINGKKIAGILSEVSFSQEKMKGIVLGIGVNLNLNEDDLNNIDIPATSLNIELNQKINSELFIENLTKRFFENYHDFLKNGFISIKSKYISYANFLGKHISIKNPNPTDLGIAMGICDDGALEILTDNNIRKKILSGDISIE